MKEHPNGINDDDNNQIANTQTTRGVNSQFRSPPKADGGAFHITKKGKTQKIN